MKAANELSFARFLRSVKSSTLRRAFSMLFPSIYIPRLVDRRELEKRIWIYKMRPQGKRTVAQSKLLSAPLGKTLRHQKKQDTYDVSKLVNVDIDSLTDHQVHGYLIQFGLTATGATRTECRFLLECCVSTLKATRRREGVGKIWTDRILKHPTWGWRRLIEKYPTLPISSEQFRNLRKRLRAKGLRLPSLRS